MGRRLWHRSEEVARAHFVGCPSGSVQRVEGLAGPAVRAAKRLAFLNLAAYDGRNPLPFSAGIA